MKNSSFSLCSGYFILLCISFLACKKSSSPSPVPPPANITISPAEGPGDTTVMIKGTGFSAIPGLDSVFFNGKMAVIISATDTQLVVSVPALAGTGKVTVRVDGVSATGPSFTYDYRYTVSTIAGSVDAGWQDGTGSNALFISPMGIVLAGDGNLYVTESGNDDIRIVTPAGVVNTLVGNGYGVFTSGLGSAPGFFGVIGITEDRSGNFYVADQLHNAIRKVSAGGVVTTLAGGNSSPGSTDGTGSAASFYFPTGIAADSLGNLYVTDFYNEKIRMVTPAGVVTTVAGNGTQGHADGPAATAGFEGPSGVIPDGKGNLYIADGDNNKIRMISAGGVVSTVAGSGIATFADGTGAAASFYVPYGITMDRNGNLIVADMENNKIRMVTPSGVVTTLAGSGAFGSSDGPAAAASFFLPSGIASDSTGNIYVADNANNRIRKLTVQ